MSDIVISVEHLSKLYTIQHQNGDSGLRHAMQDFVAAPLRWLSARSAKREAQRASLNGTSHGSLLHAPSSELLAPGSRLPANGVAPSPSGSQLQAPCSLPSPTEEFWALKDVSFEVKRGEVVGIIGRNGAGKSTLLKILSRITEPTEGRVRIRGRVASLLEVGTGFHPELTGRENIFVNGAILGMSRTEIQKKFDEIVEFSGVEKFLDTPVKRYSSGMYVRLAFAIAAYLDPEILIIDEVLAVGDAEFQKKCLGKMHDVATSGRTVLFVSHNMVAITRLCQRGVLLYNGMLHFVGDIERAVTEYLGHHRGPVREWLRLEQAPGNDVVRMRAVRLRDERGSIRESFEISQPVFLEIEYEVLKGGFALVPNAHVFTNDGNYVFVSHDVDSQWRERSKAPGTYTSTVQIPANFLNEGQLTIGAAISTYHPFVIHCYAREAVGLQLVESSANSRTRGDYGGNIPGVVRPLLEWSTIFGRRA